MSLAPPSHYRAPNGLFLICADTLSNVHPGSVLRIMWIWIFCLFCFPLPTHFPLPPLLMPPKMLLLKKKKGKGGLYFSTFMF